MESGADSGGKVKVRGCSDAGAVPSRTYIGGFLLSQLKFLLGIFKSLGVLVQLILSSLQLLLQSYQIVLELRPVSVTRKSLPRVIRRARQAGEGGACARTRARERQGQTHGDTRRRTAQGDRRGRDRGKREERERS